MEIAHVAKCLPPRNQSTKTYGSVTWEGEVIALYKQRKRKNSQMRHIRVVSERDEENIHQKHRLKVHHADFYAVLKEKFIDVL